MKGSRELVALTTTRADFGLLAPPLHALKNAGWKVSLIVSGTHLLERYGSTVNEIRRSGLEIAAEIDALQSDAGDSWLDAARFSAALMNGVAETLAKEAPGFLAVLGDRYETLAGAQAAVLANIPIVHFFGGDRTEGAIDDSIRHAITKLSTLHFVASEGSARRIAQMGENAAHIFNIGNPGLDALKELKMGSRRDILDRLGLAPSTGKLVLVTVHPVTRDQMETARVADALFSALSTLPESVGVVVTGVNADAGNRLVHEAAAAFAEARPNVVLRQSLGHALYMESLAHADLVAGNSSSGIYEAPALGVPVVNIGSRQEGRERSTLVHDVEPIHDRIVEALQRGLALGRQPADNIFGDGFASARFAAVMDRFSQIDPEILSRKQFRDIEAAELPGFPLLDVETMKARSG